MAATLRGSPVYAVKFTREGGKAVQTGFKWTRPDGMSWHDEAFGPYEPGKTLSVEGAENGDACGHGLHIGKTASHAIGYGKFPGRLFAVEGIGPVLGQDETKLRVANCRVIEELEKPAWVVNVEAFIESIATVQFFKPRRPPLKAWQHNKTEAAALAAARFAAWDAARDAARDAAWAAAWDAARAAAGDAARDARLMALNAITADLDYPNAAKHRKHLRARWKVWQMGYGLACDVDGVLYTYGVEP